MADGRPPLFLERRRYRQRRLSEAARLLAVLAAGLWMVPLLWPAGREDTHEAISMSNVLFYVFGVWLLVIAAALCLSVLMRRTSEPGEEDTDERGDT